MSKAGKSNPANKPTRKSTGKPQKKVFAKSATRSIVNAPNKSPNKPPDKSTVKSSSKALDKIPTGNAPDTSLQDIDLIVPELTKTNTAKAVEDKDPNDRRAEKRRPTRQPGMVYVEGAAWEVEMLDVSPDGVGFLSVATIDSRVMVHLKIGIGPTRQARGVRIIRCTRTPDGMYNIGAEYL